MDSRSFRWLLNELVIRKGQISVLDCITCGSKSNQEWYTKTPNGMAKSGDENMSLKTTFNNILDKVSPILSEFDPQKLVCYVFSQRKMQEFTAKDIIQISPARLFSMKIKSIHIVDLSSSIQCLCRVYFTFDKGKTQISVKKLSKSPLKIKNSKLKDFSFGIHDFIKKYTSFVLIKALYDAVLNEKGQIYLVRTYKMIIQKQTIGDNYTSLPSISLEKKKSMNLEMEPFMDMLTKTIDKNIGLNTHNRKFNSLGDLIRELELSNTKSKVTSTSSFRNTEFLFSKNKRDRNEEKIKEFRMQAKNRQCIKYYRSSM